jgi:hypothetical protein
MLLTDEERLKFVVYCRDAANSADAISRQFEAMNATVYAELAKREKYKAIAYSIVAQDLEICESFTVSGSIDDGAEGEG